MAEGAQERVVRVFVSSTFRDMHAERDHLVTVVFPELRERCDRLGLEFYDVDLRWGVPARGADGETANSWAYCRKWIDRVEPFFVSLLGQRYGYTPPAADLKDPAERTAYADLSITEMEIRHAVLAGRMRRRSFFYFRQTRVPDAAPPEARATFVDREDRVARLKDAIRAGPRPVREYPCAWTGGGFGDLETFGRLVLEDLWSGILRDPRYVRRELWAQALGGDPDADPRYVDESQPVPTELAEALVALARPPPKNPLDDERDQMESFASARLRGFQGRHEEVERLMRFVGDAAPDAPRLAVVAAVPGQGKSALLARLHAELKATPAFVVTHFVGATERSASVQALVERLADELERSGIAWPKDGENDGRKPGRGFNALCLRLAERLGDYAGERRIVLLLDALNQLTDGHDLAWLPRRLGPGVRVIASCIEDPALEADGPERRVRESLDERAPLKVPLRPLGADEIRAIVVAYLEEYCKELDGAHVDAICAMSQAGNPLYLLVMLHELRTLGGDDLNLTVPALIASMPRERPDAVSLFRWVLERLEVFGADEVRWWCLYLAHGRVGMASHELADLLARKLGAGASATALRIERGLRRYLQRRGGQLDFFHGQLGEAVAGRYGAAGGGAEVHADIAAYFGDLADPAGDRSWAGVLPRPLQHLAYHLAGAERLDALCEALCDLRFVEARNRARQLFDLLADYRLAQATLPEAQDLRRQEVEREAELGRWARELAAYAAAWNARRRNPAEGGGVPVPVLPALPRTCELVPDEDLAKERQGEAAAPARAGLLAAFAGFVGAECYSILEVGTSAGGVLQHALAMASAGPVRAAAVRLLASFAGPRLALRDAAGRPVAARNPARLHRLVSHGAWIFDLAASADFRRAVTCSADRSVRVWNLAGGICERVIRHIDAVLGVGLNADGSRAVSVGNANPLQAWETKTGACLAAFEDMRSAVRIVLSPDGSRAAMVAGGAVHLADLAAGTCVRVGEGHTGAAWSIAMTPDGRTAVSGGDDRKLRMWDLDTGACTGVLEGSGDRMMCVSVTPDGRRAVSGGPRGVVQVWDLESRICLRELAGHEGGVTCVGITPDGRRAISGGADRHLKVWDVDTGRLVRSHGGHAEEILCAAVSADGSHAVTGSHDRTVGYWDLRLPGAVPAAALREAAAVRCAIGRDGRLAVTGCSDGTLAVWDVAEGRRRTVLKGHKAAVTAVCVSPDGSRAVSGSADKTLRVWDLASGECLRVLAAHLDPVERVHLMPDGRHAVSVAANNCLRRWDLETGRSGPSVAGVSPFAESASVSADGRHAVVYEDGHAFGLCDLESGRHMRRLEGSDYGVGRTCFSPDGGRIVRCDGETLRIWDAVSGACVGTFEGKPRRRVIEIGMMPDGDRAVTCGGRGLRVWNLRDGTFRDLLRGHSHGVGHMAIMAGGRYLATSGDFDPTLRVWDMTRGEELCACAMPDAIAAFDVSADGARLCVCLAGGDVRFVDVVGIAGIPGGAQG